MPTVLIRKGVYTARDAEWFMRFAVGSQPWWFPVALRIVWAKGALRYFYEDRLKTETIHPASPG